MRTRFGDSRGCPIGYLSLIVYALVHVIGFPDTLPWDWRVYPDHFFHGITLTKSTARRCPLTGESIRVVGGMYQRRNARFDSIRA
jgi:hypothetical protein